MSSAGDGCIQTTLSAVRVFEFPGEERAHQGWCVQWWLLTYPALSSTTSKESHKKGLPGAHFTPTPLAENVEHRENHDLRAVKKKSISVAGVRCPRKKQIWNIHVCMCTEEKGEKTEFPWFLNEHSNPTMNVEICKLNNIFVFKLPNQ